MGENIFVIGLMLAILASALLGCSLSDPLTGGVVVPVPEENSTLSAPQPVHVGSASVSARVLMTPLPSQ